MTPAGVKKASCCTSTQTPPKVTKKAEDNAVILMHDEYKSSVTAALEIVDVLQKQGYEFVTVDEILFD